MPLNGCSFFKAFSNQSQHRHCGFRPIRSSVALIRQAHIFHVVIHWFLLPCRE